MVEYVIDECAMRNMAGRKDTAIVYDWSVSADVIREWRVGCEREGKPCCWQDNPAIALIFDLDTEAEEYEAWRYFHEGKYAYVEDM